MDQTKITTVRHRRAHAGARLLTALFVGGALSFVSAAASAQSEPSDFQHLETEAAKAVASKRLGDALEAFRALYILRGDPRDACHVGRTAYLLGKMPEALEHLVVCLGRPIDPAKDGASERQFMTERAEELGKVSARVGVVLVLVNKAGARVFVDGEPVGVAPLKRVVGLDPHVAHRITAVLGAERATREITLAAGERGTVDLTLGAPPAASPPSAVAPPESAEPSVPPVAPPASPVWPNMLAISGGAVCLLSMGFAIGAHIGEPPATTAQESRIPFVSVNGCGGGEAYSKRCAEYWDAKQRADAANDTSSTVLAVGTGVGVTLVIAGIFFGSTGARERVQVAPTVGGVVVRGAF